MQRNLIARNIVCSVGGISPSAFGVDEFAEQLRLGARGDAVLLANLAVMEWERARLQVLPDKLHLGFGGKDVDGAFVRTVVEAFLARIDELAPKAPIGINATLHLLLGEGDSDPSSRFLNAPALATALGGSDGRGGVHLVYHDHLSRWWIELMPQPDHHQSWTFDFNRHFVNFPDPGDERNNVLDWFADVEAATIAQFETIVGDTD
ncbi:MAG: hypothetical protein ACTHKT_10790 [Solirubrobacterales bacterium]